MSVHSDRRAASSEQEGAFPPKTLLHGILENAPDPIAALDRQLRLITFNAAYRTEFQNLSGGELRLGMTLPEMLAAFPEQREPALAAARRALSGEAFQLELEFQPAPERSRRFEFSIGPLRDERGEVVGTMHTARDVTERRRLEQELLTLNQELERRVVSRTARLEAALGNLRRSERQLKEVLETTSDGFFTLDREWRITYVNRSAAQFVRMPKEELGGRVLWDVFPEARDLLYCAKYQQALDEGKPVHFEEYYPPLDIWSEMRVFPTVEGLAIYFQDITARKKSEQERDQILRQLDLERERLSAVLDQMPSGLVIVEVPSGRFSLYNEEAIRLVGRELLPVEEPSSAEPRLCAVRHPDGRPYGPEEHPLLRALRRGETIEREEVVYDRPDGRRVRLSLNAAPIRDRAGAVTAAVAVFHDITLRREAEEQLRRLNETLEQRVAERTALAERRAEQLRALTTQLTHAEQRERRRLAMILHDHVQQLLVAAKMRAGLLRRAQPDGGETSAALGDIVDLLTDAIDATRSLSVELSPPILHDHGLAAALQWLAERTGRQHGLQVEVEADPAANPESEEVRTLLFQATRELLLNVAKHAGTDRARVRLIRDGNYAQLEVMDYGRGFDPLILAAGGEKSQSFGLFHIRERLKQVGGNDKIEGGPGQGMHHTIRVPLAPLPEPLAEAPPAGEGEAGAGEKG
jgi:PAS domain S-box-containing protein